MTTQKVYSENEKYTIYAVLKSEDPEMVETWAYETKHEYIEGFSSAAEAIDAADKVTK